MSIDRLLWMSRATDKPGGAAHCLRGRHAPLPCCTHLQAERDAALHMLLARLLNQRILHRAAALVKACRVHGTGWGQGLGE